LELPRPLHPPPLPPLTPQQVSETSRPCLPPYIHKATSLTPHGNNRKMYLARQQHRQQQWERDEEGRGEELGKCVGDEADAQSHGECVCCAESVARVYIERSGRSSKKVMCLAPGGSVNYNQSRGHRDWPIRPHTSSCLESSPKTSRRRRT